jgi:8-oxo-dGTP pyrophosphatase MutT (NUDIX family)
MKLNFGWADDGHVHTYCIHCHNETVDRRRTNGRTEFFCASCRQVFDRWIKIDPGIIWWIGDDYEYWHESAGVFVRDPDMKFLFFERNVYPFALTVPAGHVDTGEKPEQSAVRELDEEVGVVGDRKLLRHVASEEFIGDSCSRGADAHLWHAYVLILPTTEHVITVKEEGDHPIWLTIDEARSKDLTYPVKYILDHFAESLVR